jgi:hypothetical protein
MTDMSVSAPLRPLGVGEILDAAMKVYRENFRTLTTAVLALVFPLAVIDSLIMSSTQEDAFRFSSDAATTDLDGAFWAGQLASGLLSLLTFSVAVAACFHAVMRGYLGEATTWRESLGFGLRRLWGVLGVGILVVLGLIPMFILLIVPGVWLAVRWSVAVPALLAEEIGPVSALGRSFRLVKERWWATFGALVVMTILVSILQGIVGALMGFVFADSGNELLAAVIYTLVTTLAYAVTLPIQAAVFTLIYFDLRVRKEGFDLQLMAQGMGQPGATSAAPSWPAPEPSTGATFAPPQSPSGFLAPEAPERREPPDPA